MHLWLCHRSQRATTNNLDNTLPMLNVDTKIPLIPNDYQLRNSRLEATFMSRLNSSIWLNLPRNYPINSLVPTKILALPGTHSVTLWLLDTLHAVHLYFMSPCWNQQLWIWFPIKFNPTPTNHCWWWTGIWNLRNPWLQDWQLMLCLQAIVSCPLDRVWGHWWRTTSCILTSSLDMLPNLLQISTLHIQPVWSSFKSWLRRTSVFEVLFEVFTFTSQPVLSLFYSLIVEVYYWVLYLLRTQAIL